MKIKAAEREGKKFPQSSPLLEKWGLLNNDTKSHEYIKQTFKIMEELSKDANCPPEAKKYIEEWLKEGVPAMGENIELAIPQVLMQQFMFMRATIKKDLETMVEQDGEEKTKKWMEENLKELEGGVMEQLIDNYVTARDDVQKDADDLKKFFQSQQDKPGKTKADVLKELWAELPKYSDKPA